MTTYTDNKESHIDDVVYKLLYPGIIGSMFFDLLDPLRYSKTLLPSSLDDKAIFIARFAVLLIFVFDYVHLRSLRKILGKSTIKNHIHDLSIAVMYSFGYFALGRASVEVLGDADRTSNIANWGTIGCVFLSIAFLLVFAYKDPQSITRTTYWIKKYLPVTFSIILTIIVNGIRSDRPSVIIAIGQVILLVMYACFVVYVVKSIDKAINTQNVTGNKEAIS